MKKYLIAAGIIIATSLVMTLPARAGFTLDIGNGNLRISTGNNGGYHAQPKYKNRSYRRHNGYRQNYQRDKHRRHDHDRRNYNKRQHKSGYWANGRPGRSDYGHRAKYKRYDRRYDRRQAKRNDYRRRGQFKPHDRYRAKQYQKKRYGHYRKWKRYD